MYTPRARHEKNSSWTNSLRNPFRTSSFSNRTIFLCNTRKAPSTQLLYSLPHVNVIRIYVSARSVYDTTPRDRFGISFNLCDARKFVPEYTINNALIFTNLTLIRCYNNTKTCIFLNERTDIIFYNKKISYKMFKKVVVGISGGVDSAVAGLLLKNKGFNVTGVFMKNWDIVDETGTCKSDEEYEHAQYICDKIKIPLVQVNFVKDYWNNVFSNLTEQYEAGCTPNPDILCNKYIKFDQFFHFARTELGADAIATGHYVRTSFGPYLKYFKPDTNAHMYEAIDKNKDQTFFLCQIPQEALRYSMFPLGNYLKSDVKQIAQEAGLDLIVKKKESMGICFVGKREFKDFISEYIPEKPGDIVDIESGNVIGQHKGFHHWTIGQRVKISSGADAFFVYKKDPSTNSILVVPGTDHPALYSDFMITKAPQWICEKPSSFKDFSRIFNCNFRFQHRDALVPCTVHQTVDDQLMIRLNTPLRAITMGQYAVLYDEEECLGSAVVSYPGPSYFSLGLEVNLDHKKKYSRKRQQIVEAVA